MKPIRSKPSQGKARALLTIGLFLLSPPAAQAWGHRGHELVNAAAVENLPEPLRSYFRAHKAYLVTHASDPDLLARVGAVERRHHYTEVEAYDSYPFINFRRQFVERRLAPTPAQLEHGDLLWQIDLYTDRLAKDLRSRRWGEADHDVVFVAHYACDLTQPLHTALNYDCQLTGQAGIHARFESDLVNALADRWMLNPHPAIVEADVRRRIFQEYLASYQNRRLVFAADHIAVERGNYTDARYRPILENLLGLMARKRLEAASAFVSSLWYTAWVRAGKPDLRGWKSVSRFLSCLQRYNDNWLESGAPLSVSSPAWTSPLQQTHTTPVIPHDSQTDSSGYPPGRSGIRPERTGGLSQRST